MPPRMRTRSVGRPAAESLRGRIGMGANEGVEGANGNVGGANGGAPDFPMIIAQQLRNLLPAMLAQLHSLIEKMEDVHHMSGWYCLTKVKYTLFISFCPSHEMLKLETSRESCYGRGCHLRRLKFHEWLATELKSMQKAIQISGALTDEAVRNGTIKKVEKSRNVGEPSKDMNGRDDNKRTRTVNAFATTGTDISKITRKQSKTGKHGHEKRKSTREAKDSEPKPEKMVKPQSKKVNPSKEKGENDYSSEAQQDGRVKNVISRALIGSLKLEGHVAMKKAQGESELSAIETPLSLAFVPYSFTIYIRQATAVLNCSGLSWIFEASRARGFVLRSQELQILSFIWEIQYPNLID
ncbi:hypothetical protein Tco_0790986 [Tanacetum coccineum]